MKFEITIQGWKKDLNKIGLTNAIKEHGNNYALKKAKEATDLVLENTVVTIECKSARDAQMLLEKANRLHAIAGYNDAVLA